MERNNVLESDRIYLKKLGERLALAIESAGYKSPYEFWIEECDGEMSRSSLTRLIAGEVDPRVTTLLALSRLLKVPLTKLLDKS